MVVRKYYFVVLAAIAAIVVLAANGCVHYQGLKVDGLGFRLVNHEVYDYKANIDGLEISIFAGIVNESVLKIQLQLLTQRSDTLTYPINSIFASVDNRNLDLVNVYVNARPFISQDGVDIVRDKAVVITWRFLLESKDMLAGSVASVDLGSIQSSSDTENIDMGKVKIVQYTP